MKLEIITKPSKGEKKGSILFVHGVCHGAWCWAYYMEYFSTNGYDTYALSLRGHGQSEGREHLDKWGLSDYVADVLYAMSTIKDIPILIGHSMGGAILQKLLGEHRVSVKAAILLAPSVAGGLSLSWKMRVTKKSFRQTLQFQKIIDGSKITIDTVKNSLFLNNRLPIEVVEKITPLLQAESKRAAKDLEQPYTPYYSNVTIPLLVIGSAADLFFPREDLIKTATAYSIKPKAQQ